MLPFEKLESWIWLGSAAATEIHLLLMLLHVMVACKARRSHGSSREGRTSIDQQLPICPARQKRTSMADWMSCFNYCSTPKLDRQTPVFSAIVQGLDFFYYYCDLTLLRIWG
jgi:hypothetical protein